MVFVDDDGMVLFKLGGQYPQLALAPREKLFSRRMPARLMPIAGFIRSFGHVKRWEIRTSYLLR